MDNFLRTRPISHNSRFKCTLFSTCKRDMAGFEFNGPLQSGFTLMNSATEILTWMLCCETSYLKGMSSERNGLDLTYPQTSSATLLQGLLKQITEVAAIMLEAYPHSVPLSGTTIVCLPGLLPRVNRSIEDSMLTAVIVRGFHIALGLFTPCRRCCTSRYLWWAGFVFGSSFLSPPFWHWVQRNPSSLSAKPGLFRIRCATLNPWRRRLWLDTCHLQEC